MKASKPSQSSIATSHWPIFLSKRKKQVAFWKGNSPAISGKIAWLVKYSSIWPESLGLFLLSSVAVITRMIWKIFSRIPGKTQAKPRMLQPFYGEGGQTQTILVQGRFWLGGIKDSLTINIHFAYTKNVVLEFGVPTSYQKKRLGFRDLLGKPNWYAGYIHLPVLYLIWENISWNFCPSIEVNGQNQRVRWIDTQLEATLKRKEQQVW